MTARHIRITSCKCSQSALVLASVALCNCSNDKTPTGPEGLITISGKVRNIDTGEFGVGVRVSLYGTAYDDVAPVGTDGVYSIQVPAHSKLLLYTDDFNPANDVWFPFLNCDVPTLNVDQISQADRTTWPIHCCPNTHAPQPGSVTVWDNYLQNADDQINGNIFATSSSANSGGIITISIKGCKSGAPDPDLHDSMSVSTNSLTWGPYECPVRKGMISNVWVLDIDGVTNKEWKEFALCRGFNVANGAAPNPYRRSYP